MKILPINQFHPQKTSSFGERRIHQTLNGTTFYTINNEKRNLNEVKKLSGVGVASFALASLSVYPAVSGLNDYLQHSDYFEEGQISEAKEFEHGVVSQYPNKTRFTIKDEGKDVLLIDAVKTGSGDYFYNIKRSEDDGGIIIKREEFEKKVKEVETRPPFLPLLTLAGGLTLSILAASRINEIMREKKRLINYVEMRYDGESVRDVKYMIVPTTKPNSWFLKDIEGFKGYEIKYFGGKINSGLFFFKDGENFFAATVYQQEKENSPNKPKDFCIRAISAEGFYKNPTTYMEILNESNEDDVTPRMLVAILNEVVKIEKMAQANEGAFMKGG